MVESMTFLSRQTVDHKTLKSGSEINTFRNKEIFISTDGCQKNERNKIKYSLSIIWYLLSFMLSSMSLKILYVFSNM